MEDGCKSCSRAVRMGEDDVWLVGADRRSYALCCGKDGGWGVAVPEFEEGWSEQFVDPWYIASTEAPHKRVAELGVGIGWLTRKWCCLCQALQVCNVDFSIITQDSAQRLPEGSCRRKVFVSNCTFTNYPSAAWDIRLF